MCNECVHKRSKPLCQSFSYDLNTIINQTYWSILRNKICITFFLGIRQIGAKFILFKSRELS
jgi:hypothetical protein